MSAKPIPPVLLSLDNAVAYAAKGRRHVVKMLAEYSQEGNEAIGRENARTIAVCAQLIADYELALLLLDGKLVRP